MEPIRERIEDFIRRYWYEGNWVFRVLAVAVATLLALLVLRRLRVLAVAPVLIGAILVAGWLLVGTLKALCGGLVAEPPRYPFSAASLVSGPCQPVRTGGGGSRGQRQARRCQRLRNMGANRGDV